MAQPFVSKVQSVDVVNLAGHVDPLIVRDILGPKGGIDLDFLLEKFTVTVTWTHEIHYSMAGLDSIDVTLIDVYLDLDFTVFEGNSDFEKNIRIPSVTKEGWTLNLNCDADHLHFPLKPRQVVVDFSEKTCVVDFS